MFKSMGSDVRLLVGPPATGGLPSARGGRSPRARDFIEYFARCLTRFDASSELSRAESRPAPAAVPASPLLRAAVSAGVWAARAERRARRPDAA